MDTHTSTVSRKREPSSNLVHMQVDAVIHCYITFYK